MRNLFILIALGLSMPAWAGVQLLKIEFSDPIELQEIAELVSKKLSATPTREASHDVGFSLLIDDVKYYIEPMMFMAKSRPDEICHPTGDVLAYQCKEGQRFVKGCHLLFFDSQGKWVGWHTMKINEKQYPHYCNAIPAMGVADKAKNELLITMQYFFADGSGAKKSTDIGSDWMRMTSLIRVKANSGKIEVDQDDSCLGNPNRVETISDARKRLRRCEADRK